MGLVSQIFNGEVLHELVGHMAIGHTRYSTTGSSHLRNAQPLTGDSKRGQIAIAHNGNLTNAAELREELEDNRRRFSRPRVDSEIILHLLAQPTLDGSENNLLQTVRRIEGAYSLAIMTERELIGVRDPFGFRPLCLGRLDDAWVLASETCALDLISAKFVRDIEPGEIVIIDKNGLRCIQAFPAQQQRAFCIFEYVYFARPGQQHRQSQRLQGPRRNGPRTGARTSDGGRPGGARARQRQLRGAGLFAGIGHSLTKWPSCAITTSAAVSCSRRN